MVLRLSGAAILFAAAACADKVPAIGTVTGNQPVGGDSADVTETARGLTLDCLAGVDIQAAIATPAGTQMLQQACREELGDLVAGWSLSPRAQDAVFAGILAHRSAPYGGSVAITRAALVTEPVLDCDNYVMLAGYLLKDMHPNLELVYVGFDGGVFGNHAQAFFIDKNTSLLLDPTIGLAARTTFDDLLMGKPVDRDNVLVEAHPPAAIIVPLHDNVTRALETGAYRPSNLLYYLESVESMIKFSDHAAPYWEPGGLEMLLLHYPTPAARILRQNLSPKD